MIRNVGVLGRKGKERVMEMEMEMEMMEIERELNGLRVIIGSQTERYQWKID
jgi:hypothetical protein